MEILNFQLLNGEWFDFFLHHEAEFPTPFSCWTFFPFTFCIRPIASPPHSLLISTTNCYNLAHIHLLLHPSSSLSVCPFEDKPLWLLSHLKSNTSNVSDVHWWLWLDTSNRSMLTRCLSLKTSKQNLAFSHTTWVGKVIFVQLQFQIKTYFLISNLTIWSQIIR